MKPYLSFLRFAALAISALACLPALHAESTDRISAGMTARIIEGLKSNNQEARTRAIQTVHFLGDPALKNYSRILGQARVHHERQLMILMDKAYRDHHEHASVLDRERERIYELIMTNFNKDPGKITMLRQEMKSLERPFKNTMRQAKKPPTETLKAINDKLDILREIHFQLWHLDRGAGNEDWSLADGAKPNPEMERRDVLEETLGGQDFVDQQARYEQTLREAEQIAKVAETNDDFGRWATGTVKSFASVLNHQRALLGGTQMALERRLSAACQGHSEDMVSHGFFAHISPIPGKETPGDRARLAEFEHSWAGENIYAGSGSPQAAYDAWFASDGHRHIMLGQGANLLGVGVAGSTWTMMTGVRR